MSQKITATDRTRAIEMLQKFVTPSTPVYMYIEHVSASGMSRRVRVFVIDPTDQRPIHLASLLRDARGLRWHGDTNTIVVKGAGFNACYDVLQDIEAACDFPPCTLTYHEL